MAIDLDEVRGFAGAFLDGKTAEGSLIRWAKEAQQRLIALADEVERLRAEAKKRVKRMIGPEVFRLRHKFCASHTGKGTGLECSDCCADVAEERDKFRAEIARLRAALGEIGAQQMTDEMDPDDYKHADFEVAYERCIEVAREALNPKTDEVTQSA